MAEKRILFSFYQQSKAGLMAIDFMFYVVCPVRVYLIQFLTMHISVCPVVDWFLYPFVTWPISVLLFLACQVLVCFVARHTSLKPIDLVKQFLDYSVSCL